MRINSLKNIIKQKSIPYIFIVSFVIFLLLKHYPRIYGKDGFEVMWMANALREGALFSDNTWLIHPTSYFGYYPFSHRAVGVPMFLAFLISLLNFFSFGITEAILAFDILLILIIYKSSRNLSQTLFEEEWSQFLFVTVILLSQYILGNVIMIVSTRVIITIIMIVLLNLNLKILNKSINYFQFIVFLFLLLLIGALAHRLWLFTVITIIIMIFVFFTRKYEIFLRLNIFLILPLSVLTFFLGLAVINTLDYNFLSRLVPNLPFSPFFDENSLFGTSILLGWFYTWNIGLILIFFPIGVIITLYELAILSKKTNEGFTQHKENHQFIQKFYLILFIIPFSFLLPATFYSIVIFFPLIIIFSIYGIIYIKKFLSSYSEILSWLFLAILLFISIIYSISKVEVSTKINLWFVYVLSFISIFLILFVLILNKYRIIDFSKNSFDLIKLKKMVWILVLIISITIFSITTIETNRAGMNDSPYPWENESLTDEEIEIIDFFHNEEIEGLIFTIGIKSGRIAGVGFLPAFHDHSVIGLDLWYYLISPNEVFQNTIFSFSLNEILTFEFFKMNVSWSESSPLRSLKNKIILLNMTNEDDRVLLRTEYNVQFIISAKQSFLGEEYNWTLVKSLFGSEIEPVFSTEYLLVWKVEY